MTYTAQVGPIRFALWRAAVLVVPPLAGRPFARVDGRTVQCLDEDGHTYLVLDHRRDPAAGGAAYVELWRPTTPAGEGRLDGLFVLSDAHRPARAAPHPFTLQALAAALQTPA
jgi:hypothetical protein